MIDLHLHTTASDGRCSPHELVRRAWGAGLTVISVTDHDTTAALDETRDTAAAYAIDVVPGIEITAVLGGEDVHVLGYGFDPTSEVLVRFLEAQRKDRITRLRTMADRLADLGLPIAIDAVVGPAERDPGRSVGRPQLGWALVKAGHVGTVHEAFDRFIGEGRPAYVARQGIEPAAVVAIIHRAGGVASIAHPGLLRRDELVRSLARSGLDALEAFHSDHDAETTERYVAMADSLGLCLTGGSDYHGEIGHRAACLGRVAVPAQYFAKLQKLMERKEKGKQ